MANAKMCMLGVIHTGSYGNLYRAFRSFGDHIKEFDLITVDSVKHTLTRESDPDLFFAVLRGSPGKYGVLTHIALQPHRDSDHPNSRGLLGGVLI